MKVVVFTGVGQVEVRDEPSPQPGPDQVVVDVGACGICTFERRLFAGDKKWYPLAPGHEAAGVVSALGKAVDGLEGSVKVGDRVTMDLLTRCGTCGPCRRGRTALCRYRQGRKLSDGTVSFGGFAGQIAIDAKSVYPVDDAPLHHAAMGEPIACCIHSLRQGGFQPGDRVAIIGGGFMGRLHLALTRIGGASRIGVIDVSEERRRQAAAAGAHWTATPEEALATGGKQDVIFVTAMAGVELAVEMADRGGAVVLYSAFEESLPASVGADKSHREEVSIVGAFSQEPADWKLGAAYVRSGLIAADLDALVTARFGFDRVTEALTLVTTEPTFRVFVEPPAA
ncbi:MAG TPA: alcohol dehydrogenase catalytic domain-containing protein [Acidimicrobiia bacterium]|nr:alcohol dehydrogenase catalytic domain-containing protein [Acidimicrobiia bacterium]